MKMRVRVWVMYRPHEHVILTKREKRSISFIRLARAHSMISDALVREFRENGAVCIRQLLSASEIELLRQGIDENLAHPSPCFKVASRPDDPGRFVEDLCTWERNPNYKQFIYQSPCAAVAGLLMNSSTSRFYHDHLLVKEPHTDQITPWHQD
jgi:ectoine hydroxylase-related dioxygenase (phytanoyl-CoA dioxygenase family)